MPDNIQVAQQNIEGLTTALNSLVAQMGATNKGFNGLKSATDKAEKSYIDYRKSLKDATTFEKLFSNSLRDQKKASKEAMDVIVQSKKHQNDYNAIIKKQTKSTADLSGAFKGVASAAKSFIGSAVKMGGVLGVGAFGFKELYTETLKYNESLVGLGQAQRAGSGEVLSLGGNIDSLTESLVISKGEFLGLARSMSEAFVGIPPGTKAMSELYESIQSQSMSNEQAAKSWQRLQSVQQQDSRIYDMQVRNLATLKKARDENRKLSVSEREAINKTNEAMRRRATIVGVSAQAINEMVSETKELTSEEARMRDQSEAARKVQAQYKDTLVALGQAAMPIFTKMAQVATKFLELMEGSPDKIMGVVGAFTALKALKPFVGLVKGVTSLTKGAAMLGGGGVTGLLKFGGSVAAAGAAGYGIGKLLDHFIGISDWVGKFGDNAFVQKLFGVDNADDILNDNKKLMDQIQQQYSNVDVSSMFKNQGGNIQDIEGFGVLKSIEKQLDGGVTSAGELADKMEEQRKAAAETNKQIQEGERGQGLTVQQAELQLKVVQGITESQNQQIANAEEFGRVDRESYSAAIRSLERQADLQKTILEGRLKLVGDADTDFKFDPKKGAFDQVGAAIDAINKKQAELVVGSDEYLANEETLSLLSKAEIGYKQKKFEVSKKSYDMSLAETRNMEKMTSKAESRLEAEKKLMESAQFGMGASVEMMQKQVALASKMKDQYVSQQAVTLQTAQTLTGINAEEAKCVLATETIGEAEAYIKNTLGKTGQEASDLTRLWGEQQDLKTKELQQQQKIYDITKDVREGYLDAMTEMAAGAGEFSKIIGTQDKGVTQLMQSVKDATGEDRMNTMALGGMRAKDTGGGRTKVAGSFTGAGYKSGRTKGEQEGDNKDIYGYKKEYNAGTTVGTASVGTKEVRAAYEAGDMGTKNKRSLTDSSPINPGIAKKEFSGFNYQDHKANLMKLSTESAASAKGQPAASGVQTLSPGTPYGGNMIKIEVTLKPTGELSKYVETTKEIVSSII